MITLPNIEKFMPKKTENMASTAVPEYRSQQNAENDFQRAQEKRISSSRPGFGDCVQVGNFSRYKGKILYKLPKPEPSNWANCGQFLTTSIINKH